MKPTKQPVKHTKPVFLHGNVAYLCVMEINIFSSDNKDRGVAVRRHLATLLTAVLINMAFWFFQSMGELSDDSAGGLVSVFFELFSTCIETIVVMEASFAVSRIVIRSFWNVRYSFGSLLLQNILLLLSVVLISAAVSYTYAVLYPEAIWLSWDVFLCDVIVAYFLTSVFFTSYLTNRYRKEKELAQQVTIDKLKLKTDNHFVFNSLATLGSLIQTDPQAAVEFNSSMSSMYRYIVSKGDCKVVSMSEELSFMEEYRKNMEIRHGGVIIKIEDDVERLDSLIPPLTLQGLVENAIKHNRHGANDHLTISIVYDSHGRAVVVSNNNIPLSRSMESSGIGLETMDHRYMAICGKGIAVCDSGDTFSVSLPVIKQMDLI